MLWTELCHPQIHEALTNNVDVFGDGAFKETIKVKWGHKGGALIQYD